MSAENSRLVRSIRRIAREPADQSGSVDPEKARGDQPGGTGVGESDGERDRICCDGSTSDNANPGTSERDTSDGGQGGLDPIDPASLESGPGELAGVVDCSTGQPVCFEGDGFIPPEGWEDPSIPPKDETWVEGVYWKSLTTAQGFDISGSSPSAVFSAMPETWFGVFGAEYTKLRLDYSNPRSYLARYSTNSGSVITHNISARDCDGQGADLCPHSAPTADSWPSDGCVNLAIKGGSIVGSKYDPENDGSYSAPRDEIELCDPETGDSILIRPSPSGGWKSIKSLAGDIDPDTGNGYLYAPDGRRIRQISPSEFRDDTV